MRYLRLRCRVHSVRLRLAAGETRRTGRSREGSSASGAATCAVTATSAGASRTGRGGGTPQEASAAANPDLGVTDGLELGLSSVQASRVGTGIGHARVY